MPLCQKSWTSTKMSWLMAIRSTLLVKNVVWVGRLCKLDTRLSTGKPPIEVPPYLFARPIKLGLVGTQGKIRAPVRPSLPSPLCNQRVTERGRGQGAGEISLLVSYLYEIKGRELTLILWMKYVVHYAIKMMQRANGIIHWRAKHSLAIGRRYTLSPFF